MSIIAGPAAQRFRMVPALIVGMLSVRAYAFSAIGGGEERLEIDPGQNRLPKSCNCPCPNPLEARISREGSIMANESKHQETRIDQFFAGPGARADRWRDLVDAAEAWSAGDGKRGEFEAALGGRAVVEGFNAYPGARLTSALRETA